MDAASRTVERGKEMSKGVFIEGVTVEMIRLASLEAIETLLSEGYFEDVEIPRWMPTSARQPEENGTYLVTMTKRADADFLGEPLNEVEVRKMRYHDGWKLPRHVPEWINDAIEQEVIAWQPLPEPYREDGEA